MEELIESLESCVRQSTFVSDRYGRIPWNVYRQCYRRRVWNDQAWMLLASSKLEIADRLVADLATRLEPVLAAFVHTESGRFGNGLFLLRGGPGNWAHPTVAEFAKILIEAAVKLGSPRAAALLLGWADGEPLRFKVNALLDGAQIEGPVHLVEGISMAKLPASSADLPASLPAFTAGATDTDFMGGIVMSIDYEMSPALFLPDNDEVGHMSDRTGEFRLAGGQIPNLSINTFCDSMSLACNGPIDWFLEWNELGDLEAFYSRSSRCRFKYRSHQFGTNVAQADLNEALRIQHARHKGGRTRANLELAMRRWIRSKRAGSNVDKLIELRIALEALYEIGGLNEKGFRIATYGAWHLGNDFEQRLNVRETLRKSYSESSSAVHGGKLKYAKKDPELVRAAQDICREAILKRLEEEKSRKWDEIILGANS